MADANLVLVPGLARVDLHREPGDIEHELIFLEVTQAVDGRSNVCRSLWIVFSDVWYTRHASVSVGKWHRFQQGPLTAHEDGIPDTYYIFFELEGLRSIEASDLAAGQKYLLESYWVILSKFPIASPEDMAAAAVRSSPIPPPMGGGGGNKRKRGNEDMSRNVKTANAADQETNYAALLQGIDAHASDDNTRTAQAALAGAMDSAGYPDSGFDAATGLTTGFGDNSSPTVDTSAQYGTPGQTPNKPAVGTPQWHTQRKENHKEVERRRREVINEGIENIAKIVPGTEKNKGAILQRTAQYIQELQDQIAKYPTERQTYDITIKELSKRIDQSKDSVKQAWVESNKWQQRCRDAGLAFDDFDGEGEGTGFEGLNAEDLDAIGA